MNVELVDAWGQTIQARLGYGGDEGDLFIEDGEDVSIPMRALLLLGYSIRRKVNPDD